MTDMNDNAGDRHSHDHQDIPDRTVPAPLAFKVNELVAKLGSEELRPLVQRAAVLWQWEKHGQDEGILRTRIARPAEQDLSVLRRQEQWWEQPKGLLLAIARISVAAVIQGWDQSGTNGANLFWTESMGIAVGDCFNLGDAGPQQPARPPNCVRRTFLLGLVNSAPYIMIAFVASWLSDPLNHFLGRKWTIIIATVISVCTPFASAVTHTWQGLLVARLFLGLGMGLKEVTVPILIAELAPPRLRGAFLSSWQIFTALGIALGCTANLVVLSIKTDPDQVWRYQLASAFIPAALLLILALVWGVPESPHWLVRNGEFSQAYWMLQRIRGRDCELLAAKDLFHLHEEVSKERMGSVRLLGLRRFKELFTRSRYRRPMVASSIVMISQQLCGINILSFYSSTIFATIVGKDMDAYQKARNALLFALGAAILNFVGALPALLRIDTWGRRSLLLRTIPLMGGFLLIAGGFSFLRDGLGKVVMVVIFLYFFVGAYSPGMGPIPFSYAAEVFPVTHREAGMGWAVAMNNFFGSALSLAFPSIWDQFRPQGVGPFFFFTGLNVISFVLVYLFVRETARKTLEEMNLLFDNETWPYMRDKVQSRWHGWTLRIQGLTSKRFF